MKCEACQHENIAGARFCANCGALMPAVSEPGADPMIGQLIGGRYRVTGVLGEGGMGIVYVGEQQMGSTVRKVAIKTLHAHLSKDPSVLARFHRECGTVAQLEHPNTIKFYDFGSTADGTLYIAMEFVAGHSLADIIQHGPLSPERVTKIMRQICGALDEAHMQGIIHRDLKPENIVLTDRAGETDFVKVLDFGIAARTESADAQKGQKLTQQGMVLGTPPYMSPEQFTGKALDSRSDIYSLGVMAYEMLVSRLPFDADTPWQWATQHMSAQPIAFEVSAPSKNFPEGMRKAILRALSKNREDRQPTAREFFAELSDGGRMTVESHHDSNPGGSSGTSAMAQVPNYLPPPAPMMGPPMMGAPMGPPIAAVVPPAPMGGRGNQSGGGKGLVIGLGVVGGVLLIAIAVLAARSMTAQKDAPVEPLPTDTSAAPTPVQPVAVPTAVESSAPTPTAERATAEPAKVATAAKPATPAPSQACTACMADANQGNISGAAANFSRCADATKKAECTQTVKNSAPQAVKTAALNGNCAQAKAMIAAAQGMGAGSGKLIWGLAGTSCR
ncbi:MAG TPA: serine/threonine-protein kinase [Polyangiaceae bacterium]|nr:serine/threonine-protein kinase [Polyangiaceae bacterium]